MHSVAADPTTSSAAIVDARDDLHAAVPLRELRRTKDFSFDLRAGRRHVWIVASRASQAIVAMRVGLGAAIQVGPDLAPAGDGYVCEFSTSIGAVRAKIDFPGADDPIVHCTTTFLPTSNVVLSPQPRDVLIAADGEGTVYAAQRGLRSGVAFAGCEQPSAFSLFYVQDFSSLNAFFSAVKRTPADTVGGTWPELGFRAPSGDDCVLRQSVEYVTSDAYLSLSARVPASEAQVAAAYLDRLAAVYTVLPRPEAAYHDWPARAAAALRDVSLSPECTYVRNGTRYLMPYVGDATKPPESMVQLTALVNTLEYDDWRGERSALARALLEAVPSFYDPEIGSLVRWLPGASFGEQSEENMNHESMDSWYLYHSLFNLWRLAERGHEPAKEILRASLPFAVRVARRFDYQWPIFFNLKTLDIVRAEAEPGKGGEHDVGGLYALIMIHAYEMFGDAEYLEEAKRAALRLAGYGFKLAYQMNTTGFAAEGMLRLWQMTGDRRFLELSEICMANLLDNMWLWRCEYGHALHYRTFFGLFPLHDAPYLAAYEELEAQAKFRSYLALGGDDVRPSLRLLLAEYQKYGLDRAWFYYPDALPVDAIAKQARNGAVRRALSVPLEDLQDGREMSGQVGQEVYGCGLAFVYASRYYRDLTGARRLFCNYPFYDFAATEDGSAVSFRVGGDPRGTCEIRVMSTDADARLGDVTLVVRAGEVPVTVKERRTPEGHVAFDVHGGQAVELRLDEGAG